MRFLANENFPGDAVTALEAAGHDIVWVRTAAPGSKDQDILAWAARESRVLLTFDKDFGELAWHLDTAFCALPSGDVIYYPGAFVPAARGAIEERVAPAQRISLEQVEAVKFAANAMSFDHCLVLSSCTALRSSRRRSMHSHDYRFSDFWPAVRRRFAMRARRSMMG